MPTTPLLILFFLFLNNALFTIGDTRNFVPGLYEFKPFIRHDDDFMTRIIGQPFILTAGRSFDDNLRGDENGLFDIYGCYDQVTLDKAILESSRSSTSFLRSDLRGAVPNIPWIMRGHMEAYGLAFMWYQEVCPWFGFGVDAAYLHVSSRMLMERNTRSTMVSILGPGDEAELLLAKEQMARALGVTPPLWTDNGFSDLDVYLRLVGITNYKYKFRRIEAALKLGLYIPTAHERDINNPASLAFGGDKHWGFYVDGTADFVLKEDLTAGFLMRVSKRFSRTSLQRMPVLTEPTIYGALVGPANVNPGVTFAFAPYLTFEGVRDGLGFRFGYTLVLHEHDTWTDLRNNATVAANIGILESRSRWGQEYVTVGALYDFAKDCDCRGAMPVVSLTWDIPVSTFVSERAFRTNAISLIIESDF